MATPQDSMLAGLFTTPEQYQQQRQAVQRAQAIQMASLDPFQQGQANIQMGINRIADVGAGALGVQDPALKLQSFRQQVLQGVDQTDPQSLAQASYALNREGDTAGARQLAQLAQAAALNQSQVTKNLREGNAAMLTPEQRNATAMADASGAVRGTPEWTNAYKSNLTQLTAKDVRTADQKNFEQAVNGGYKGNFNQWLTEQKRAGATNVSLSASADKSYGSELGGLVAKDDIAMRNAAQAAPDILSSVEQTRALLDSGRVYTGTGANVKLNVLAFGQALGVTGATENEIITQTQQLQQQRSKAVLNQIKSSGLGTGQGFTDKDLKFLENASAGTITLSADTLKEQLKIEEKLARASVNKWNARVKTLPAGVTGSMGLSPVELPTTPYRPVNQIPTTGGMTGNPLVDKYLPKQPG
jgi:hypothetical protein